jgi:thymidylate synthase
LGFEKRKRGDILVNDINRNYKHFVSSIITYGNEVICRGHRTIEIIGNTATIDMKNPLVTLSARKLGYKFAFAEAAWILSGENRVEPMRKFSKTIADFSDDEVMFAGAYGPRIVDQLPYIVDCFKRDIYSRQAVINIWRDRPYPSKDIPCTLSIQFLIRENKLHVIDIMRSSDAWLGAPYDWFNFSMLGAYVVLLLKQCLKVNLELGSLYFHAASSHLYIDSFNYKIENANDLCSSNDVSILYHKLNITEFSDPSSFLTFLWSRANKQETVEKSLEIEMIKCE